MKNRLAYIAVSLFLIGVLVGCDHTEYKIRSEKVKEEQISYKTKRIADNQMWEGRENVAQSGKYGIKAYYKYVKEKYVNEVLENSSEVSPQEPDRPADKIIKKPVDEIIKYGTKKGYPRGYTWEIRDGAAKVDIQVKKIFIQDELIKVNLHADNHPDSCDYMFTENRSYLDNIGLYYRYDSGDFVGGTEYSVLALSLPTVHSKTLGLNILRAGQSADLKVISEFHNSDIMPKNYFLDFQGKRISLEKFWAGSFNQEKSDIASQIKRVKESGEKGHATGYIWNVQTGSAVFNYNLNVQILDVHINKNNELALNLKIKNLTDTNGNYGNNESIREETGRFALEYSESLSPINLSLMAAGGSYKTVNPGEEGEFTAVMPDVKSINPKDYILIFRGMTDSDAFSLSISLERFWNGNFNIKQSQKNS